MRFLRRLQRYQLCYLQQCRLIGTISRYTRTISPTSETTNQICCTVRYATLVSTYPCVQRGMYEKYILKHRNDNIKTSSSLHTDITAVTWNNIIIKLFKYLITLPT